jgi:ABC-type polysaccharide/polyol phosphate export permease
MKRIKKLIVEFKKYKELIWHLAITDLKLRYNSSVLGYVWTILEPLLTFLVIYIVFSQFRSFNNDYFALQLITAIILFQFFSAGSFSNITSLKKNASMITNIYIPHWVFIISSTLYNFLVFLTHLLVIIIFFSFNLFLPSAISLLFFSFYIFILVILITGIGFLLAPLYIKFRDIGSIWSILMRALFYATPIIWPLILIPEKYHQVILMNPLAFITHFTKEGLINNHNPSFNQLIAFTGIAIVFFFISLFVYKKTDQKITESL